MTRPSWFQLSPVQYSELSLVVPSSTWRLIPQAELPSVFPPTFRQKIDSAIMVSTPTSTGGLYLAYSAHRVDFKARQIDIEPFGLVVHSSGQGTSGVFLHHGDWEGRTAPPPADFWDAVTETQLGDYFLSNPPAGLRAGSIQQLPRGHRGAFESVIKEIRLRIDGSA